MHELRKRTLECYKNPYSMILNNNFEDWETEVLLPYFKERAEWFKKKLVKGNFKAINIEDYIDQAFQINAKSLEEKLKEGRYDMGEGNPDVVEVKWAARLAREHFRTPEGRKELEER